jgi:hypothetical protein
MGSIPLPALQAQAPQASSPLENVARVYQLKNMMQQNQAGNLQMQQQQEAMQSQKAIMRAYSEAGGDLKKAIPLAAKYGAQPDAIVKLQTASTQQQEQNIALLNAKGTRAIQEADLMQGVHDQIAAAKPEDRPQLYQKLMPQLQQAGVDVSQAPPQYPGDEAFAVMGVGLKGHKQQLEELQKQQAADEAKRHNQAMEVPADERTLEAFHADRIAAEGLPDNAKTRFESRQAFNQQKKLSTSDVASYTRDYLAAHNLPDTAANRLTAHAAFTKETRIDPGVTRAEIFINRPTEVADPNHPGETIMVPGNKTAGMAGKGSASVQTPRAEARYMTSGKGGQQLTAFNTAMVHLNTLDRLAGDLNNSNIRVFNRAAQKWADETGNAAPANFAAAKNAMSGEVAAALKASGATDQEIEKVSSTFDRAQSPSQLKGAINTYRELLRGKASQLQKQYESGMQGRPNFPTEGEAPQGGGKEIHYKIVNGQLVQQ